MCVCVCVCEICFSQLGGTSIGTNINFLFNVLKTRVLEILMFLTLMQMEVVGHVTFNEVANLFWHWV